MAKELHEEELRKMAVCGICKKKIGHTGIPMFYRVTVERFIVDMNAIQRLDGLSKFIGSPVLASVMGPNEALAKAVQEPVTISVCQDCSTQDVMIAVIGEMSEQESK